MKFNLFLIYTVLSISSPAFSLLEESEAPAAIVYKILTETEFNVFLESKVFEGSEHDRRDGFIHLVEHCQIDRVVATYFKDQLVFILGFRSEVLGDSLVWEGGYPHLYGKYLKVSDVIRFKLKNPEKRN
ncbi:MAG: DUF952 domain-containing protein [Bdellovibrionales bacterium]